MIKLNPDQVYAIKDMQNFISSNQQMFLLEGQAGTGKTTCIHTLVRDNPRLKFVLTAPTNKATMVLRSMSDEYGGNVDCRTIYSVLGLKVKTKEDELVISKGKFDDTFNYDVIVIDEGSMVNRVLCEIIKKKTFCKFIVMLDPYQLPPVGEQYSLMNTIRNKAILNKVERHDNQILTLATHIRNAIEFGEDINLVSNYDKNGGIYVFDEHVFTNQLEKMVHSDSYRANPELYKVISWRNNTVRGYNDFIRSKLYGLDSSRKNNFVIGERVIATHPITVDKEIEMYTDEEGVVKDVNVRMHPNYDNLRCYEMIVETNTMEGSTEVNCLTIHQDSKKMYENMLSSYADEARDKQRTWKDFWDLKQNKVHDIRPSHSITAHRSQGSTYNTVFIDVGDILSNSNTIESFKCLYVAETRATRAAVMVI